MRLVKINAHCVFLLFARAFFTNVLSGEKQRKCKNLRLGFWKVACFGVFAQKPFGSFRQRIFCFLPGRFLPTFWLAKNNVNAKIDSWGFGTSLALAFSLKSRSEAFGNAFFAFCQGDRAA